MVPDSAVAKVFARFSEANPKPVIELHYVNIFTLTVAVLLSAQSTDVMVNKITKGLFAVADNPHSMLALGEFELKKYIKSIGLYNNKAKNIIKLSKILVDDFQGEIIGDFDFLISLPGIGRKSANVILNSFFGIPTIAVDTHVFRVSNRIGFVDCDNVLDTENRLLELVPSYYKLFAHHWLVLHGRYVCKAKNPSCSSCLVRDLCVFNAY